MEPRALTRFATAALFLLTAPAGWGIDNFARPDFQNLSGPGTVGNPPRDPNPGLIHIQGVIAPAASAPTDGIQKLTEASFGQPFAPFTVPSVSNPGQSHAQEVIAQVRSVLYPTSGSNRAQVLASGAAFRYKWLLFSPEPGETDVTTHFQGMGGWWSTTERGLADAQIAVLRDALAVSPTDTGLRDLLLEVYYDYAIAEMQFAKQKLAALAAQRLGLVTTTPFVIDAEIQTYEELVMLEETVLDKYAELLSMEMEGMDPSEFDEREPPGTPMGLYIFKKQQPYRNAIASEYATDTGVEVIPDYNEATQMPMPRAPENLVLFSGYKDYVNLLTIMAQYTQHQAELARLRGMRQGPNDLTKARNAIGMIQSETATDFLLLRCLFGGLTPIAGVTPGMPIVINSPGHGLSTGDRIELENVLGTFGANGKFSITAVDGDHFSLDESDDTNAYTGGGVWQIAPSDASGVKGALNGMETALAEITNVRAFINGKANVLGLDENFLLLVQDPAPVGNPPVPRDSFDVLFDLLKGPSQPLSDALAKMTDATTKYQNFRASVDRVVAELADVDNTFQQRYLEITGYAVDEVPGFEGFAKPDSGSELDEVEKSIGSLQSRNHTLRMLSGEIEENLKKAQEAVTLAEGLDGKINAATQEYIGTVRNAYRQIGLQNGLSAAAQTTFDGAVAAAGLDLMNLVSGGVAITLASGINAGAQAGFAQKVAKREGEIDIAAVNLESAFQRQDNALTVNQARQEVGAILREQHSIKLETTDNTLALAQAMASRTALLGEVQRIIAEREEDQARVRSSYYADPIQFVRSENSLILADSAFRNAQRWVFYTQRALEYKWQQAFVWSEASGQGIRNFDSGTVFKLRNAMELDDLLTQLKAWNDVRFLQDSSSIKTTFISLKDDVFTPNPNIANSTATLRVDPGVRVDLENGEMIPQLELFRRLLTRSLDQGGNLNVDFDTSNLDNVLPDFFVGPNYTVMPLAPGEWRDKIVYIKVNIIAEDGTTIPQNIGGALTYGGQTFFRTRIPPCPDRSVNLPPGSTDGVTPTDLPGEFMTAPFRYYSSATYNNVFTSTDSQTQNITVSYLGSTAKGPTGDETIGQTYQFNSFNQYSVAATRWRLSLFPPPTSWDVSLIKDIELIIKHKSSDRLAPVCP